MAESTQFSYPYKELVTLMVKDRGLHEGHWALVFKFALRGANIGATDMDLIPTAMIGIMDISIQKVPTPSSLSVDASEVNPVPKLAKKKK